MTAHTQNLDDINRNYNITRACLMAEAEKRSWPVRYLGPPDDPTLFFGITPPGRQTVWFKGSTPQASSHFGCQISLNKALTLQFLQAMGSDIPPFTLYDEATAATFLEAHAPIAVKPVDAEQSKGVTVGVTTLAQMTDAVSKAQKWSRGAGVILQKQLTGRLYRLLVIGDRLFAAAYRRAAFVTGDGARTVEALIAEKNRDPRRSDTPATPLKLIDVAAARAFCGDGGMHRVLAEGEELEVSPLASVSAGGEAYDVTNDVHPSYAERTVAIASAMGLAICGFDILTEDITLPCPQALPLLETNSLPGFKLHLYPAGGEARDPAPALLDALFPGV